MTFLILEVFCVISCAVSVVLFILTTRKLAATISLGRELSLQIKESSLKIDIARQALSKEVKELLQENENIKQKLKESNSVKSEINQLIAIMEKKSQQLESSYHIASTLLNDFEQNISKLKNIQTTNNFKHQSPATNFLANRFKLNDIAKESTETMNAVKQKKFTVNNPLIKNINSNFYNIYNKKKEEQPNSPSSPATLNLKDLKNNSSD